MAAPVQTDRFSNRVAGAQPIPQAETAPVIFFEVAPLVGIAPDGVCRVGLVGMGQNIDKDGETIAFPVMAAHLRGSLGAFLSLRDAINRLEAEFRKPEGDPN